MLYRRKKSKKSNLKLGDLQQEQDRARQFGQQRQHAGATRSTLSRLRNRKSDLK
jgi:hypothetical protein